MRWYREGVAVEIGGLRWAVVRVEFGLLIKGFVKSEAKPRLSLVWFTL